MMLIKFLFVLILKHFKYYLLFAFLSVFYTFKVSAVQENYVFKQIKIDDGLSQSTVSCMLQDRKGYLWFGTPNGLNRYDGYNFKIFSNNPLDTTSLSDNGIASIFEDKNGLIWIGTLEGILNRYDHKTGTFKRYYITDTLRSFISPNRKYYDFHIPFSRYGEQTITAIAEDNIGNLWIGTWGKGLINFNKNTGAVSRFHFDPENEKVFNSNCIISILFDGTALWVGTIGDGLFKIINSKDNIQFYNYRNDFKNLSSLSDDRVVSLIKDSSSDLWIGTYGGGLNRLTKSNQSLQQNRAKFIRYQHNTKEKNSLANDIVTSIIEDSDGIFWIGTYGGGLDKFDKSRNVFYNYRNDPNISSTISKNEILSLIEDRSGNLWVGTVLGKGLSKIERNRVKFKQVLRDVNNVHGLNDDVVWAILGDDESNLWIGTYKGGLNRGDLKKGTFTYYKTDPGNLNSISDNHIRTINDDGKGNLLIGTYSGGLSIFNKFTKKFRNYRNNPNDSTSISANQVLSIMIDSEKNYWIGTFGGGLNKINHKDISSSQLEFKKYMRDPQEPFSLSDDRVYMIYEDSENILWIGTFGGGLNKFDKKNERFISYKNIPGDESSLSDNQVMCIYEDKQGMLWIGTYGGGLQKFDKRTEKFTRFDKKNSLNSSVVYGILEDNNENLWMSSDNGLFKFNMKTELFTQYDINDGLQSLEFSGGAYFKSKNGEMYFGGVNGINYFYPDSIKDNRYVPPIVISTIKIFGEPIKGGPDTLYLSYNQNFISLEIASLDYTNPPDNQYAYKLKGLDDNWHYVNARERISNYTNLSPGVYIFQVRGSNNDGVWNNAGTQIYLIIKPPFWQTWWFLIIVLFTVAFIIYYLSTLHFRNLLAIEKLKSKLSADLHDNVGSGLTEISILSELVSNEIESVSQNSSQRLKAISEKARSLIDSMSDIVWMVNPQRDSLYHLILRLKDSYSEFLISMGISFGTMNIEKFASIKLPMEYKQNIFLIFKEGINNAIKHSRCKKILLEANINKDNLEIVLKDDGIGMDNNIIKFGNGMINMKNRAKTIGGKLEIQSTSEGTLIKYAGKITRLNKIKSSLNK